jgi:uncharacterized alkaline shock family protein YloU
MSQSSEPSATGSSTTGTAGSSGRQAEQSASVTRATGGRDLVTGQGQTRIADVVVQKIAGLATRDISGVYKLGGGTARALGAVRERIPGARASTGQGVTVEVGERQTAVDLDIVAEYGVAITDLAQAIRRNVISSIEQMTGLEVTEVNISVDDIHLPDEGNEEQGRQQESRVQ